MVWTYAMEMLVLATASRLSTPHLIDEGLSLGPAPHPPARLQ
jgi:hypothetical protein